jgi:hypothetical protein
MDNELQVDSRGTENHDDVWRATAQVLRAQVSEAVWFSTFNDAVAIADVFVCRFPTPTSANEF